MGHGNWIGECVYPNGEKFPFQITITARKGPGFIGFTTWTSLNAQTKIRGVVDRENLKWEEFEVLQGEDAVVVPVYYNAKLVSNNQMITGRLKDPEGVVSTFWVKKETFPRINSAKAKNPTPKYPSVTKEQQEKFRIEEEKKKQKEEVFLS